MSAPDATNERATRYRSHALVEVRRHRWWPFAIHSAVLLDLSESGFKAEFTGEIDAAAGRTYWLSIPLSPLGINHPDRLTCRGEFKWFDNSRFRFGGIFIDLTATQKEVLQQVIAKLAESS